MPCSGLVNRLAVVVAVMVLVPAVSTATSFTEGGAKEPEITIIAVPCTPGQGPSEEPRETCNVFEAVNQIKEKTDTGEVKSHSLVRVLPEGNVEVCNTPLDLDWNCNPLGAETLRMCQLVPDRKGTLSDVCLSTVKKDGANTDGMSEHAADISERTQRESRAQREIVNLLSNVRRRHELGESGLPFRMLDPGAIWPLDDVEKQWLPHEDSLARVVNVPASELPSEEAIRRYLNGEISGDEISFAGRTINDIRAGFAQNPESMAGIGSSDSWKRLGGLEGFTRLTESMDERTGISASIVAPPRTGRPETFIKDGAIPGGQVWPEGRPFHSISFRPADAGGGNAYRFGAAVQKLLERIKFW